MTPGGDLPRFEFATAARIVFGLGTAAGLPEIVAGFGQRVLVVAGARPERHRPVLDALRHRAATVDLLAVAGEPTLAVVEEGVRRARRARCEVVLALGGGSALDAGKAIAALAATPGEVLDYLEVVGGGAALPGPGLPCIAAPTTAGTGAEVTRNAVLTVPAAGVKVSLRSPFLLPRVALVDPELTYDLPTAPTAATGLDALTQLIEPYLSNRANPLTDTLCRDGIGRVATALPLAVRDPRNAAARSDLGLAALYSGLALANAGLGAVHGFAAPIGGLFPAPHGAVCAALLPHVLRANLAALQTRAPTSPTLQRFDEVARLLTGRSDAHAADAVAFCAALVRELAIPPLATWGVGREHLPAIVAKAAVASSMKGNPIVLTPAELTAILEAALEEG